MLARIARKGVLPYQALKAIMSCSLLDVCQLGVWEELGGARLFAMVLGPLADVKGVQHCS